MPAMFRAIISLLSITAGCVLLLLLVLKSEENQIVTAAPSCGPNWEPDPSPPIDNSLLKDVVVISDTDAWAVGAEYYSGPAVVEHWDGKTWTQIPLPKLETAGDTPTGGLNGGFEGVAAIASDDVWAVGSVNGSVNYPGLIEHWDGTEWSIVPHQLDEGIFFDVAAIATDDVWAVGHDIEHWDGSRWSTVPYPELGILTAVSATATDDVWAVGSTNGQPLIEHWDGNSWSVVPDPELPGYGYLEDVSALAHDDVWAVGRTYNGSDSATLTEHWDGNSWSVVPSPSVGTSDNYLWGVKAIASDDVWAVGQYWSTFRDHSLIQHWNGTNWSVVQGPHPFSYGSMLFDIDAVAGNNVWAVGMVIPADAQPQTLIARYNPYPCPPTPTRTPGVIACGPEWHIQDTPDIYAHNVNLVSVDAISNNDAWAVGSYFPEGQPQQHLIEHWDGYDWSVIPGPVITPLDRVELRSVSASTSNDVWAVGSYGGQSVPWQPLLEHWDGSVWSVVPGIALGSGTDLLGVAAVSANDVWVVGSENVGQSNIHTFIAHWDGSSWTRIASPNPSGTYNRLHAVHALSSSDVWAVGTTQAESIIMHWDGTAWSLVPGPNPGSFENSLKKITAVSGNDVWALGSSRNYDRLPLIVHWDGASWSQIEGPDVDSHLILSDVAAASGSDLWVVGYRFDDASQSYHTLMARRTGNSWAIVPSPNVGANGTFINAAVALSSTNVWAVGYTELNAFNDLDTVIESYSMVVCPPTPTPEPPRCPGERFTDVCPTDYFYQHVRDLNDLEIISGYNTIPPCDGPAHLPCFKPYNWSTRGQIAKVVSLAAGFNDPVTTQHFEDVPPAHTFYQYIERMANYNIINGYPCGGPGEPCGPYNLGYFRPGNTVSRGQLAKMAALAFGFLGLATTQTFEDVPPGYTFYHQIENLAVNGIIGGYECGNPEPCVPPHNRPYYRPGNNISRGQIAKIVNLARLFVQGTPTPTATNTIMPTLTGTPTSTSTVLTPSPSPTCCTSVTGSATGSCSPSHYSVTTTITNSCPFTVTAYIASEFQVSPNSTGPWQTLIVGDCWNCPIPPGQSQQTFTIYSGPLPAGNNWWRYRAYYSNVPCVWNLLIATDPQPACVVATATPTSTITATPAMTQTPTSTPTNFTPSPSPTCCTSVTGSVTGACQPEPYTVTVTLNNSCPVTLTADTALYFDVSPNENGPWQPLYVGDCWDCPIPSGKSIQTYTVHSGPLPAGNNWWRYRIYYSSFPCVWNLLIETGPQPACVVGTATPTMAVGSRYHPT